MLSWSFCSKCVNTIRIINIEDFNVYYFVNDAVILKIQFSSNVD